MASNNPAVYTHIYIQYPVEKSLSEQRHDKNTEIAKKKDKFWDKIASQMYKEVSWLDTKACACLFCCKKCQKENRDYFPLDDAGDFPRL